MTATTTPRQTVRDIINKYSPIVRGKTGWTGAVLKIADRPLEWAANAAQAIVRFPIYFGYENTAGQYVGDCKAIIPATLRRMEKKLQSSFNAAAADKATQHDRLAFLRLAREIKADAAVLKDSFNVVNGIFGTVPEKYTFIVRKQVTRSHVTLTTLQEGIEEVQEAAGIAPAKTDDPFRPRPVQQNQGIQMLKL